MGKETLTIGARRDFELVESTPERVAGRFYSISVILDPQVPLFGDEDVEAMLVIVHGRLGRAAHVRRERFVRFDFLEQRWWELCRRRLAHRYVERHNGSSTP